MRASSFCFERVFRADVDWATSFDLTAVRQVRMEKKLGRPDRELEQ